VQNLRRESGGRTHIIFLTEERVRAAGRAFGRLGGCHGQALICELFAESKERVEGGLSVLLPTQLR